MADSFRRRSMATGGNKWWRVSWAVGECRTRDDASMIFNRSGVRTTAGKLMSVGEAGPDRMKM